MISKCDSCSYLEEKGANRYCSYHDVYVGWMGCEDCNLKPVTNADHIRAMSDEELAEYLDGVCHDLWQMFVKDPRKMWLDWLKEEAKYER